VDSSARAPNFYDNHWRFRVHAIARGIYRSRLFPEHVMQQSIGYRIKNGKVRTYGGIRWSAPADTDSGTESDSGSESASGSESRPESDTLSQNSQRDMEEDDAEEVDEEEEIDEEEDDAEEVDEDESMCWLCNFCTHPLAAAVTCFVSDSVGSMGVPHIAAQVRTEIIKKFPYAVGASVDAITIHIESHMLLPSVRMASMIRSLTTVAETIQEGIRRHDEETDEVVVDRQNTELYLKVTSQIMAAYKMDQTKMLYGPGQAKSLPATTSLATHMMQRQP